MRSTNNDFVPNSKSEVGAVLILVAMLCVILIGLLGLALDSFLLASGKSKQERIAEYAALAALET